MQKNEVANLHPGWKLSRKCVYDTLMSKRTGEYEQNQFFRVIYNTSIRNLRRTQLAKFDSKYIVGRILKMQEEKKKERVYKITIRETNTYDVEVKAGYFEEAVQVVEKMVCNGEVDTLRPDCVVSEYFATCDKCGKEFWEYDGREVDSNTSTARLLCDECVAYEENNGGLTRCENCGDVFSPQFLETNPENGESEICPYCKEVWCD